ncbi:MAG: DUF5682 family protein [Treponema sp.]|jgi:hypothetical protein|nr:DUF5682 family protein [Treponema sp.]
METTQQINISPNIPSDQAWRTAEGVYLFGIRHLSAAGAWHVRRFLDQIRPEMVLIESPSDTEALIHDLTREGVKPPVAVLCYTADVPVHSIVYPLASYSPEYQCLLWAREHKKPVRFIDLPSDIKTQLYRLEDAVRVREIREQQEAEACKQAAGEGAEKPQLPDELANRFGFRRFNQELYEKAAGLGGENSYDAYWERLFEHNLETGAYLRAVALHSAEMRRMTEAWEKEAEPLEASVNALREAYMKRRILEAISEGFPPNKIAAVMGAYHISGVMRNEAMNDRELGELPRAETRMTLMPYSYYRLSSFSGYGAGNYAPYYFELMYEAMEQGRLENLPARYITQLSRLYREKQGYSSTASAIEAVRLAKSLQYLHGGLLPTLSDLHDSATAAMAGGHILSIAESFAALDVGTRIGSLPEGVSQTPIQDDMNRLLKKFKLEKYRVPVAETLELDLRENRRVQNEEAAFIGLECSIFLNRLFLLNIGFAQPTGKGQDMATWKEVWTLCWTPEVEIRIVESVLYGDTVEAAASFVMKERLEKAADVLEVAELAGMCYSCRLTSSMPDILKKLQALASESESFTAAARAGQKLSFLIQSGNMRKFETSALVPILQQLFLKAALLLHGSASCNYEAARDLAGDMAILHIISQEHGETVNDEIWLAQLKRLARADDRNPLLSGFAFSILMEHNEAGEEEIAAGVSRHLSAGNTPEAGAAWFEGLSLRNRQMLLSRIMLWQNLDAYLASLSPEDFKRALVCLRRAFTFFDRHEKNGICEVLAGIWGVDSAGAQEILQDSLSETEEAALDELKDFDLGDF